METQEQKNERVARALQRIQRVLDEEFCELEPFILISSGILIKKEINVVAKSLPSIGTPNFGAEPKEAHSTGSEPEGGTN